ncbi:MAG: CopG family transcriptional regulator [Spirochaetales bacterium]|nr:CopG family transcriptional regulator [Spirochaetales bacterium]
MTTVRLNDEIETKLSMLTEIERSSKSEVIKKAIAEYYDSHYPKHTPYELGANLFGKYGADEDLSKTYKSKLKDMLSEKHSH